MNAYRYRTKVELVFYGTSITCYSQDSEERVIDLILEGQPFVLKNNCDRKVVVNPSQIPAIEVYANDNH